MSPCVQEKLPMASSLCEKMLYISCKPTSLARDLVEFAKYGYRVEKVCCVDMFPGTVHCETVVLLSQLKQKPDVSHR